MDRTWDWNSPIITKRGDWDKPLSKQWLCICWQKERLISEPHEFPRMWVDAFTDFRNFKKKQKTNSYSPAMSHLFYLEWLYKSSGHSWPMAKTENPSQRTTGKNKDVEYIQYFFHSGTSRRQLFMNKWPGLLLGFCFQKTEQKQLLTISTPWGNAVPSQSFLGKRWMILPHPSPDPKIYREKKKDSTLTEMCNFSTAFFFFFFYIFKTAWTVVWGISGQSWT